MASLRRARAHTATRPTLLLAYAGSALAVTGVQLIAPALPAIRQALELSDSQVGLVVSLYLLPGVLLAIPIGLVTERVGRRVVYCCALLLMGSGGGVLLFAHDLLVFFAIRLLQGVAFAALLPLAITMIGDAAHGRAQVRAQGHRNIVMATADTIWPLIGGAMLSLAWFAPFAVQLAAIPLAAAGWWFLDDRTVPRKDRPTLRSLAHLLRNAMALALQLAGFLRFLFKFALLSYLSILLDGRGASPLVIAVSVSAVAAAGIVSAWIAPAIVRLVKPSTLVGLCLLTLGTAMAIIAVVSSPGVAIAAMLLYGFADSLYAVLQNSLMVTAVADHARASFVAAVAAVRNIGKFAAPLLVGALLLGMRLEYAFLALAAVAVIAIPSALPFRRLDHVLQHGGPPND